MAFGTNAIPPGPRPARVQAVLPPPGVVSVRTVDAPETRLAR